MRTSRGGELSEVQERTLRWIRAYIVDNGIAPSLREIGVGVGCSRHSAQYRVFELAAVGLLTLERGRHRSIRLVTS